MKDDALNAAAEAVRAELIRLDFVEGDKEPDGEDKAIAAAAIKAWLLASADAIRTPSEYSGLS